MEHKVIYSQHQQRKCKITVARWLLPIVTDKGTTLVVEVYFHSWIMELDGN